MRPLKDGIFYLSESATDQEKYFLIHDYYYQGAWSLSECSHWSIWLDIICIGADKFGRDSFPKKGSKS